MLALWLGPALSPGPATAKVFHSQESALALAFPDADRITSQTRILTAAQSEAIQKLSRARLDTEIVRIHSGWRGEELLGYAYIDVHTVRTQAEAFMVVLTPDGAVRSLRVLAFYEPLDYLPTERWVRQFEGKSAADSLRLGGDVHGIVGATLSARAVTESVRRVLAFYRVLLRERDAHPAPSDWAPSDRAPSD
ncbi:MAG: FMN-binding protein [Proteobacteria bacterium]|nr:FMN-binding protein [Pseudomonadota bacterium]